MTLLRSAKGGLASLRPTQADERSALAPLALRRVTNGSGGLASLRPTQADERSALAPLALRRVASRWRSS